MEVPLTPDLEAKLARMASVQGRAAEMLAREAIERLVDYDDWFVAEVKKGVIAADKGKLLSHEEVGVRIEKHISKKLASQ